MVDSFYSSTIKPHFSYQNNNIKRRHNPLINSSTCTSTIKTQPNSSTLSRGRDKSRSSPHHRNNLRHTNYISSTAHQSQSTTPIVLSPINISNNTDKNQHSNTNIRPHTSVPNPYSQPNFHVSECKSNYRSTFSNNTCSLSEPRSRSQSLPRFYPLSPIPSLPHLLSLEITTTVIL